MSEARDHSFVHFSGKMKLRIGRAGENHKYAIGCEEDLKGWNSFAIFLGLGVVI